jgi:hypothetical protein
MYTKMHWREGTLKKQFVENMNQLTDEIERVKLELLNAQRELADKSALLTGYKTYLLVSKL